MTAVERGAGGWRAWLARCMSLSLVLSPMAALAERVEVLVPADTRVYVTIDQEVVGKKKQTHAGQVVPAHVWRDIAVDGRPVILAGTPVVVRVDEMTKAKIAGRRGKLTLGAYTTTTVGGEPLQLAGGYNKAGKGRIALSASLAAFVFLPLIFMKGKAARLPRGTVFDAYVALDQRVEIEADAARPPSIDLGALLSPITVEVLYEELEKTDKPERFTFRIHAPAAAGRFTIDTINDEPTEPIALEIADRQAGDGSDEAILLATVDIKTLAKGFTKGINRFHVATTIDGERAAAEVILDIQF